METITSLQEEEFAKINNALFFETSAKDYYSIKKAFYELYIAYLNKNKTVCYYNIPNFLFIRFHCYFNIIVFFIINQCFNI